MLMLRNGDSVNRSQFKKLPPVRSKLRIFVLCLLLFSAFFLVYNSHLRNEVVNLYNVLYDRHQFRETIQSFGPFSPLVYILIQILQVVIAPIPGGPIEFLGGYVFGVKAGFLYSMIGLILGSWVSFSFGRVLKRLAVERFVSPWTLKKFDYLTGHQGVSLSFLLFLIPGFPKDAFCYLLGLTRMNLGLFLVISTVGRVPGTLMASFQGGKAFDHQYKTFLILIGVSVLVILVFCIYEKTIHSTVKKWAGVKA